VVGLYRCKTKEGIKMFIVSKTIKGKEFIYSSKHSILCKNKEQAKKLATFMNEHNESALGIFKLEKNEIWYVYEIDKYDTQARYKLKNTKNKISIVENY
jgi:hypothetical protein